MPKFGENWQHGAVVNFSRQLREIYGKNIKNISHDLHDIHDFALKVFQQAVRLLPVSAVSLPLNLEAVFLENWFFDTAYIGGAVRAGGQLV